MKKFTFTLTNYDEGLLNRIVGLTGCTKSAALRRGLQSYRLDLEGQEAEAVVAPELLAALDKWRRLARRNRETAALVIRVLGFCELGKLGGELLRVAATGAP